MFLLLSILEKHANDRRNGREVGRRARGFCTIMTDQRSGVRKLEVPVNGASMQLSVEPRVIICVIGIKPSAKNPSCLVILFICDRANYENPMRSAFLELISEYPFPVVSRLGVGSFQLLPLSSSESCG